MVNWVVNKPLCLVSVVVALVTGVASAEQRKVTDFARLMPPDTLLYAELSDPAGHIERLAGAMGLMGTRATSSGDAVTIELDDGFVLSSDFRISPSLLAELNRVRGAAIGISGPFNRGEPTPLIAIDPGESSLLRGLIETGIQVVPRADAIGGYPTYHHEEGLWCVQTPSLFIVSNRKDTVVAAVKRLGGGRSSLYDNDTFAQSRRDSQGALLFAYVDGENMVEHVGPMMKGEAAVARAVFDLDHMQCATAMVTATASGAKAEVKVRLDEDHNSLAYGLIRTVPFRREIFEKIPASAALVAAVGINPPLRLESGDGSRHLTALDIGREFFANLAEVGLFVLPSAADTGDEVPDFGFVVRANDAERSEALWSQLLALPTMLGSDDGPSVKEITVAGRSGRRYTFPDDDAPVMDMIRVDDATIVTGTQSAVRQAMKVSRRGDSILGDEDLAQTIRSAPEHASKAVFAHVGRLMALGSAMENGRDAQQLAVLSQVLKHMKVVAVSDEAPHQLTVRLEASELPVFEEVIRMVAQMQHSRAPQGALAGEAH